MVFSKFKKWLFGNQEQKEVVSEAKENLKDLIKKHELESKKLFNSQVENKQRARQLVKEGNKTAARTALKKAKLSENRYVLVQNKIQNLESRIQALSDAVDVRDSVTVVKSTQAVLDVQLKDITPEVTDELQELFIDQQDQIATMNETLADTEGLDSEIDDFDLDEELDQLETKIQVEKRDPLPPVEDTPVISNNLDKKETPEEDTSDAKEELTNMLQELKE